MMHVGPQPLASAGGVVTSVAWAMDGKIDYVLEGNINYTGAVMKWICDDLGLIRSPCEAGTVAASASLEDETYLIPAFTGLGAPYWDSAARAILCNMSRHTGKAEIVRAAEECIAYQIADIVQIMQETYGAPITSLRVDGGPTKDSFLMQFQSDILDMPVAVSAVEELSGTGAAFMAGIGTGLYDPAITSTIERHAYTPTITPEQRAKKREGWRNALGKVLTEK
jgi:glycerol kinase